MDYENNSVPIQDEAKPEVVLEESAKKLAAIASKFGEIFRAGYDAGFIGTKTKALLESYKRDLKDYIDKQFDFILTGQDGGGILDTIDKISAALEENTDTLSTVTTKITEAKDAAIASAKEYTDNQLIPVARGGTGATTVPGAINALAQMSQGTPSTIQIIYDSMEKTGVIESCTTREFLTKINRGVANIEFPHSKHSFNADGSTTELVHLTDAPEDFGYVTLSWNNQYRVRGMFYSSHTAKVYVYSYRKDWDGVAYEVEYNSESNMYIEKPDKFMIDANNVGVTTNLSLTKVENAFTDTERQVYLFGNTGRFYCMHEDEIEMTKYPDYGWKELIGYRGGTMLGTLFFENSSDTCGGRIQCNYDSNPLNCGFSISDMKDISDVNSERSGIKLFHSADRDLGSRIMFASTNKQLDEDGNEKLVQKWYKLYGEHNFPAYSLASNTEAGGNASTTTHPMYAGSLMLRDSYGRSSIQDPEAPKHIANRKFVEEQDAITLDAAEAYADDAVTNALSAFSISSAVTTTEGANEVTLTPANGTPTTFTISEAKKAHQDKNGNDITEEYVGKPSSVSYEIIHLDYNEKKTIYKNTFYYVKIRLVDDVIDAGILYTGDGTSGGGTNVVVSMNNSYKARVVLGLNSNNMCTAEFIVSAGTIDTDDVEAWLYLMNKGGSLK